MPSSFRALVHKTPCVDGSLPVLASSQCFLKSPVPIPLSFKDSPILPYQVLFHMVFITLLCVVFIYIYSVCYNHLKGILICFSGTPIGSGSEKLACISAGFFLSSQPSHHAARWESKELPGSPPTPVLRVVGKLSGHSIQPVRAEEGPPQTGAEKGKASLQLQLHHCNLLSHVVNPREGKGSRRRIPKAIGRKTSSGKTVDLTPREANL